MLIAPIEEDGLLGIDFLFAQNFVLCIRGLKLNGQEVTTEVEGISLDYVRVSVREGAVIPPNSQLLVSAKLNVTSLKHTTALFEPITGKEVNESLVIGKSLVDLTRVATYLPVHLMNVSAESLFLHKDTVVGQLSEVDSISLLFESESSSSPPIPRKTRKFIQLQYTSIQEANPGEMDQTLSFRSGQDLYKSYTTRTSKICLLRKASSWQSLLETTNMHLPCLKPIWGRQQW